MGYDGSVLFEDEQCRKRDGFTEKEEYRRSYSNFPRPMEEQFDWKNCQSRSKVQQSCYFPSNPTNSPTLGLQTDRKRLSRAQKTALDVTLFHSFVKNTAIYVI